MNKFRVMTGMTTCCWPGFLVTIPKIPTKNPNKQKTYTTTHAHVHTHTHKEKWPRQTFEVPKKKSNEK